MNIAFIGLGIMGRRMSANLARKLMGKLVIADAVPGAAEALAEEWKSAGALSMSVVTAKSNAEAAAGADVVITMVPRTEDVQAVYKEILPVLSKDAVCIDMSTIDPSASAALAEEVRKTGADFMDAPVVKSAAAAESGTLGIYMGGNEETCKKARPVLECMGSEILYLGKNGSGLVMKLCHNALATQIQNGVNETLSVAKSCGIDPALYAAAIGMGGAKCAYLDNHVAMFAADDYPAAFTVKNAAKDVGLFIRLASEQGFAAPGEELVSCVYEEALAKGLGSMDWGATIRVVEGQKEA